jgi:hypothetical protein
LVAAAEIYTNTGLDWLARYTRDGRLPVPDIQVSLSEEGATVDACGADFLVVAPAALDLATDAARRNGHACIHVHGVADLALTPSLNESAARRGLATLIRAMPAAEGRSEDADQRRNALISAGWPGHPLTTIGSSAMVDYGVGGDLTILATITPLELPGSWRTPAGDGIASLSTQVPETYPVPFDLWCELLDFVGGTLPPDGRGLLTRPDEANVDEAGPGAGKVDDDD